MSQDKRRLSVVTYVAVAFSVCLLALSIVIVITTRSSFDRERRRTTSELRSAAMSAAQAVDSSIPQVWNVLHGLATQPPMVALDPEGCRRVFGGLESVVEPGNEQGHMHVVRADGSVVCSLTGPALRTKTFVAGTWLRQVVDGHDEYFDAATRDTITAHPAMLFAVPITTTTGPGGALVFVAYADQPAIDRPTGASHRMLIVAVDRTRSTVLATTPHASVAAGSSTARTPFRTSTVGGRVLRLDGTRWLLAEAGSQIGWRFVAGLPYSEAMKAAYQERNRNGGIGLATVALVAGLGLALHWRLARPLRDVGRAIEASGAGDEAARAPIVGPAEVVRVADAFNDLIVERQARERDLYVKARTDELTGLANRRGATEFLNGLLRDPAAVQHGVAVLFTDLDRFKNVNDAYGHASGDRLLDALGARLRAAAGPGQLVARFGGDEFLVIAHGVDDDDAVALAEGIAEVLHEPFHVDDNEVFLTGSVGIALARKDETAEDLVRNADTAMYRAKAAGRGGWALFDRQMRDWAVRRMSTERDLHRALEHGQFELHYQPKIHVTGRTLVGLEALVRWRHPERGLLGPGEFVGVAEETGMITNLTAWVLQEAARQIGEWRSAGLRIVPVAVNVSPRELTTTNLAGAISDAISERGVYPWDLIVEVTESAVVEDPAAASIRLQQLRRLGTAVSIDDFGTGYSSLEYLQRLPFDELKLDRMFVAPLDADPSSRAIVQAVIALAHGLGVRLVAEGVERSAQLDVLRALGCDLAQGFHLGRPVPAAEIEARLALDGTATGSA